MSLFNLVKRLAYLCPRFDEFQQVGPGLIDLILPLSYRGRVRVACADQLVTHSVRGCHAFGASVGGIARELAEFLDEQLWTY